MTTALAQRPNWRIYILGKNADRGHQATEKLGHSNVVYHQCDVSKYQDLANVFHSIYSKHGHVDHVFANAGVPSIENMMAKKEEPQPSGIPPEPNVSAVDVNFTSVVYTAYLALHYFRSSPGAGKGTSLVINGSIASLNPATINMALYSATKRTTTQSFLFFMHAMSKLTFHQTESWASLVVWPKTVGKRVSA